MLPSDGGLFFSEFTDEDIHPKRMRACLPVCVFVCVCVCEGLSESAWQRFTTAAAFTQVGTGEGHPEQNGAYASVPQLRPSAQQTGLLPWNELLCSPGPYGMNHICVSHA